MVKTIHIPINLKIKHSPMTEDEHTKFVEKQTAILKRVSNYSLNELDQLLISGYEVLTSHVVETDTYTHIVFVLYLSPDAVKVPF